MIPLANPGLAILKKVIRLCSNEEFAAAFRLKHTLGRKGQQEQGESHPVLTKDVCVSQPTEEFLVYLIGRSELQLVMEAIF